MSTAVELRCYLVENVICVKNCVLKTKANKLMLSTDISIL